MSVGQLTLLEFGREFLARARGIEAMGWDGQKKLVEQKVGNRTQGSSDTEGVSRRKGVNKRV